MFIVLAYCPTFLYVVNFHVNLMLMNNASIYFPFLPMNITISSEESPIFV
jgi:hypothetical protein